MQTVYPDTIEWDHLPHDNRVGYGREGLILRLNDDECIKIFSPHRSHNAEKEFRNYGLLRSFGLLAPKERSLVQIHIGKGKKVMLPGKCEFRGIGLYPYDDVETTQGIIREFISGLPYGEKKPSIKELRSLFQYLVDLDRSGLTVVDMVPENFISSKRGATLIDVSTLTIDGSKNRPIKPSEIYENYRYFISELKRNLRDKFFTNMGLESRIDIAKALVR